MSGTQLQPACIAEGDLVIIYFSREQLVPVIVEKGKQVNSRYGHYPHDSMIDVPFGSKVASKTGKGFAYLLKPTPELWTLSLPHRTQILYMPDIAFVTSYLNILPGSRVIEAGTGSGSFSHSVARTVGHGGNLFSFEFHEDRYKAAKEEFQQHKLDQIQIEHRNVCKDGFPQDLDNSIDGIFLDLPAPWEAVDAAKQALRKDRPARICCFSPCIEQVLRTVTALGSAGFQEITMFEALIKNHDQVVLSEPPATIFDVMARLKSVEQHKEARRLRQIEKAHQTKEQQQQPDSTEESTEGHEKRQRDESADKDVEAQPEAGPSKRVKLDTTEGASSVDATAAGTTTPTQAEAEPEEGSLSAAALRVKNLDPKIARPQTNTRAKITKGSTLPEGAQVHSRVLPQTKGHTSYLTFATLLPLQLGGDEIAAKSNNHTEDKQNSTEEPIGDVSMSAASGSGASQQTPVADSTAALTPAAQSDHVTNERSSRPTVQGPLASQDTQALVEGVSFGTPEESL